MGCFGNFDVPKILEFFVEKKKVTLYSALEE